MQKLNEIRFGPLKETRQKRQYFDSNVSGDGGPASASDRAYHPVANSAGTRPSRRVTIELHDTMAGFLWKIEGHREMKTNTQLKRERERLGMLERRPFTTRRIQH